MKRHSLVFLMMTALFFLLFNFSWAECPGDNDCDGDVDALDLSIVASNFGRTDCGLPASTINPENYQAPVGMEKVMAVKLYNVSGQPTITTTVVTEDGWTKWIEEDGSYCDYYPEKEECYNADGDLLYTCLNVPDEIPHLPDGITRVDETWGGYFVRTCDGGTSSIVIRMYTFLGIEDVTVPAGTFVNCLKIYRDRGNNATISWYAPGMGWVKRVYSSSVYELESFRLLP